MGFRTQVLVPDSGVPLEWMWGRLRGKFDGLLKGKFARYDSKEGGTVGRLTLGVHGAALTHLLFLPKGDSFIQVRSIDSSFHTCCYFVIYGKDKLILLH